MTEKTGFSKNVTMAAKGIAIMLMLIHHLFSCWPEWVEQYGVTSALVPMGGVMALSVIGKVCVSIFVLLSAYGITLSLGKANVTTKDYVKKRLWKLEKGFWFVFVIALLTCFLRADRLAVYFGEGRAKGILYILFDGTGLANFFNTPMYNETWWYMSLAILMVFLIPMLAWAYDKFSICVIGVIAMLQFTGIGYTNFTTYLLSMILGVWLAKGDFLAKVKAGTKTLGGKLLVLVGSFILFLIMAGIRFLWGYMYWTDALMALGLILFLYVLVDQMRVPLPILRFVGKHSMNVFLTHTLIFQYYFTHFIYSPRNWFLIFLLLLILSLAVSIVIEFLKKVLRKMFVRK